MSATRLNPVWNAQNTAWHLTVGISSPAPSELVRQIVPALGPQRCPGCQSIIYSRRHRLCSVCAEPIPDQLLFNHTEMERVEELLRAERDRHRTWMRRW